MFEQLLSINGVIPFTLALVILSAYFGFLYIPKIISTFKRFRQRPPVIKKYWYFVAPFSFSLIILYSGLFFLIEDNVKIELYINVLNQFSTLVFAIFIGYFSFLQVIENRADKLKNEAHNYLHPSIKDYARAVKNFEDIVAIEPNDFYNLANLLETYLIQKDFQSFHVRMDHLKKCIFTPKDNLVYYYVMILYFLLKGHHDDADLYVNELIQYTKANSEITMNWNFGDFKSSDTYSNSLKTESDGRRKFDNLLKYITKTMSAEDRAIFEAGDYILRTPVVPVQ